MTHGEGMGGNLRRQALRHHVSSGSHRHSSSSDLSRRNRNSPCTIFGFKGVRPAVIQLPTTTIRLVRQSLRSATTTGPARRDLSRWIRAEAHSRPLYRPEHAINRRAAVLVLLFEREGSLRVLLTTRSKNLRSHPGQTALPGGKYEETDESLIATAVLPFSFAALLSLMNVHSQYREAFEEIALDITSPHLRTVATLPPFLSAKGLIVTPTIGLLIDPSVILALVPCQDEVDLIFDHPLKAFLDPSVVVGENLVPIGSEKWKWLSELHV